MPKVIYYNVDKDLAYEKELLAQWGISDLELIEVKNKDSKKPIWEDACEADGMVVVYDEMTQEVFEHLPNLKMIAMQSIGYNNIDVEAATKHGVYLTNVPGFCVEEVALHAVGMTIDLARKITYYDRTVRAGKWDPQTGYPMVRIAGQTFGMVFFGAIPQRMVPMLKALGLKLLVYAPTKTAEYLQSFGCQKAETLEQLLKESDFVSLHTPLTEQTRHLISEQELKQMKSTAYLINTARGAVVDEKALVKALQQGWIRGAAVDVIEDEKTATSELFDLENTIITPHAAFLSEDSFYEARRRALEQLVQVFVHQKTPTHLRNPEVIKKNHF